MTDVIEVMGDAIDKTFFAGPRDQTSMGRVLAQAALQALPAAGYAVVPVVHPYPVFTMTKGNKQAIVKASAGQKVWAALLETAAPKVTL